MTRRAAAAALAVLAAVVLTGCTAEVTTRLEVTGPTEAQVTATVVMRGEAATTVAGDEALLDGLTEVFRTRLDVDPDVDVDGDQLTVTATVSYETLTANADVLGVSSAVLSGDEVSVTATVTFTDPAALREAITAGVATMTDGPAVADTMIGATQVRTVVHFPGGVDAATATGDLPVKVDGDDVTVARDLAGTQTGQLVVTGDPTGVPMLPFVLGGGAVVAAAAVALVRRRR